MACPPFLKVSADVAGPYIIKLSPKVNTMVWVLLYLCDVSKALHLELVENYSGPAMVTALKSVFAIRNCPSQISTDPVRNFV